MAQSSNEISWRSDDNSFFSQFPEDAVRALIEAEMRRHLFGVENGKILPFDKFYELHMEHVKRTDAATEIRKKTESAEFMTDSDSLNLLDAKLRELLGSCIPPLFSYHTLYNRFGRFVSIGLEDQPEALQVLLDALCVRRTEIDGLLKKLHESHTSEDDELSESKLSAAVQILVRDEIHATDGEDRWFYWLTDKASLYMESVGCAITMDEIDNIAEKYFESWVTPSSDDVERFADELAAMGIKRLFARQYGQDGPSNEVS